MKIKNKIDLIFLLAFIVIAGLVFTVVNYYFSNLLQKNIYSYLESSSRTRAEHIRTFIQDEKNTSIILVAASVYRDFLKEPTTSDQYRVIREKIDKRLVRTMEADNRLVEVFIIDNSGKIVASSDKTQEGADRSTWSYFTEAKDKTYFNDVYFSGVIKKISYTISSPIIDDNGKFLGVSVLRYLPNQFFSLVKNENGLGDTEENFLINKDKLFLTPSRFWGEGVVLNNKVETVNSRDCFNQEEIDYIKTNGYNGFSRYFGNKVFENKDYRGEDVVSTHHYIPETGWCLITKVDRKELFSYRSELFSSLMVLAILAILFFLLFDSFASKKITKPILELQEFSKKIEKGDMNAKINITTNDEVEDLSKAFISMLTAVKQSRKDIEREVVLKTKEANEKTKQLDEQKNAILNILEDVQKEKDRAENLANDLEKFKLAVDNASDHIIITDPEGIVLYGNKVVEKITGYKLKEALGKKAGKLWSLPMPKPFYEKLWDTIKNKKQTFGGEIRNRRKNGEEYIAAISISPVLDKTGNILFFVGLERDITKQKEVDQEKTEFVSLASHQLKTPVGSISWNLEMLSNGDYGPLSKKQKDIVAEMYTMNLRMNELINSLLNVSRIEMGVFIIDPKPLNFIEVCEDVLEEMKPKIIAKGHKITKNFSKDLPIIPADHNLLRIIFQNYISNAIKYTPDKGRVSVGIEKKGDEVIISVANNGEPIPEKDKSKIFNKMFRASNAQEQDPDGNGIGLYLVKKIAENGGGKAWFESGRGKDTVFYISFPLTGMLKKEGTRELTYN